jgi:hypothetical protein
MNTDNLDCERAWRMSKSSATVSIDARNVPHN